MDIVPPKDKVLGEQETLMNPTPNQSVEGGSGSQNMNLDANCSESHQRKNEPSVYRAIRLPEVSPILRPKFLDPVVPGKGPLQSEEAHHQQLAINQQKKKNLKKPRKKLKCNVCEYSTVKKNLLSRHKEAHTRDQKMKCQICSYSTNIKRCLTVHLNRDHSNIHPIADENANSEDIERNRQNEAFENSADARDNGLQVEENPKGLPLASPFYGFESRKVPHPFESTAGFSLRKKRVLLTKKKISNNYFSFKHTAFRKKRLFNLGFFSSCLKKTNGFTRKRCQDFKHKFKLSNKKSKLNFRRSFMVLPPKNQSVSGSETPPQRSKIYKCALCDFNVLHFPCNADKIVQHEKAHVQTQLHKCSRCSFSHRCLNILNIHLRCHHRSIDQGARKIDDEEEMEDRDCAKDANLESNDSNVTIIARDAAQSVKENGSDSVPEAMEDESSEPPDLGNDNVMDDNRIEFDNPPDLEEENNALRSTIPQMQRRSEKSLPPKDPEVITKKVHLTNGPNEDLSLRLEPNPEASKSTELGNDVDQQVVPGRAVVTTDGNEQSQSGSVALVHEQLEISNPSEAQGDVILLTCTDSNQSEGNNLESNGDLLIEASMSWLQRFSAFFEPAVEQTSKLLDSQELHEQLAIAEGGCRQLIDELLKGIQSDSSAIEQLRNCIKHRQQIRSEKEQNINLAQIKLNAAKKKVQSTEQVRLNFLAKEKELRETISEMTENKLELEEALLSNQLKVDEAAIESSSFIKIEDEVSESATLRKEIRSIQQSLSELKEDLDVQLASERILKEDRQRAVEDRKTASDQMCTQQLHLRELQRDFNVLGLSLQDQSDKLKKSTMSIAKMNEIRCQLHCCFLNIELLKRISG